MIRAVLLRLVITGAAFAVATAILSGMEVNGGFWAYVWISLIFGVVNAIIGTVLRILTLPVILVTIGLFSIVINAVLLEITDLLTSHLSIDSFFWTAIWAAIIITIVSVGLEVVLGSMMKDRRRG